MRRMSLVSLSLSLSFLKKEGKEGRKRGRETSMYGCLSYALSGDLAHNQACARTGNQSGNSLVHRPALNPLSHTSGFNIAGIKYHGWYLIGIALNLCIVLNMQYLKYYKELIQLNNKKPKCSN